MKNTCVTLTYVLLRSFSYYWKILQNRRYSNCAWMCFGMKMLFFCSECCATAAHNFPIVSKSQCPSKIYFVCCLPSFIKYEENVKWYYGIKVKHIIQTWLRLCTRPKLKTHTRMKGQKYDSNQTTWNWNHFNSLYYLLETNQQSTHNNKWLNHRENEKNVI